jgi:hypothetical protein
MKKSATLCRPRMKRTRKCPWRIWSGVSLADPVPDWTQCRRMSVAFDMRWATVSDAMPMATSLSQNRGACCGLRVAHVGKGQDFPLFRGVARCVRWRRGWRTPPRQHRNRRQECGWSRRRWSVYPVIVVGEAEVAQAAGDAACVGAGEEGGV